MAIEVARSVSLLLLNVWGIVAFVSVICVTKAIFF